LSARVAVTPADTWFGIVPARRNQSAFNGYFGSSRRPTITGWNGNNRQKEIFTPLQFPAIFLRRSKIPARAGTARDWAWDVGRKDLVAIDSIGGGIPLHHPGNVGDSFFQRFDIDGGVIGGNFGVNGRGSADQSSGKRHFHGNDVKRTE